MLALGIGVALRIGVALALGIGVALALGHALGTVRLGHGLGVDVGTGQAVPLMRDTDGRGALTAAWAGGCEQAVQTSTNKSTRRRG